MIQPEDRAPRNGAHLRVNPMRTTIPAVTRPTAIRPRETRAKNLAVNIDTPLRGGELPPGFYMNQRHKI
jgi:hypothetical protein